MKPSLLVLNRYSYTHILAHGHTHVYYVRISVCIYFIHNVHDRIRISATCVVCTRMQKGDVRVCVSWLVADIYFLSLRCAYVRHRCEAEKSRRAAAVAEWNLLVRLQLTPQGSWHWGVDEAAAVVAVDGCTAGGESWHGRGASRSRVLMSYVCDAETPKLAHAIVNVYVYPL